jgi:hypothetical protein
MLCATRQWHSGSKRSSPAAEDDRGFSTESRASRFIDEIVPALNEQPNLIIRASCVFDCKIQLHGRPQ